MEDELMEAMREIVDFHDNAVSCKKEIAMWRNKFLASLPKENHTDSGPDLWSAFLYMPTLIMVTKSPEQHIKDIQKVIHENQ